MSQSSSSEEQNTKRDNERKKSRSRSRSRKSQTRQKNKNEQDNNKKTNDSKTSKLKRKPERKISEIFDLITKFEETINPKQKDIVQQKTAFCTLNQESLSTIYNFQKHINKMGIDWHFDIEKHGDEKIGRLYQYNDTINDSISDTINNHQRSRNKNILNIIVDNLRQDLMKIGHENCCMNGNSEKELQTLTIRNIAKKIVQQKFKSADIQLDFPQDCQQEQNHASQQNASIQNQAQPKNFPQQKHFKQNLKQLSVIKDFNLQKNKRQSNLPNYYQEEIVLEVPQQQQQQVNVNLQIEWMISITKVIDEILNYKSIAEPIFNMGYCFEQLVILFMLNQGNLNKIYSSLIKWSKIQNQYSQEIFLNISNKGLSLSEQERRKQINCLNDEVLKFIRINQFAFQQLQNFQNLKSQSQPQNEYQQEYNDQEKANTFNADNHEQGENTESTNEGNQNQDYGLNSPIQNLEINYCEPFQGDLEQTIQEDQFQNDFYSTNQRNFEDFENKGEFDLVYDNNF